MPWECGIFTHWLRATNGVPAPHCSLEAREFAEKKVGIETLAPVVVRVRLNFCTARSATMLSWRQTPAIRLQNDVRKVHESVAAD